MKPSAIPVIFCSVGLLLSCVTSGVSDYYYHHVWMSDTDNPTYPRPGALSERLWESFSYWDGWARRTSTLQIDPSREEVLAELATYRGQVHDGDVFLFYYTGHGERVEVNGSHGEASVLSLQTWGSSASSGITTDILTGPNYFGGFSEGATIIVVFDTCYAGEALSEPYGFDVTSGGIDLRNNTGVLAASRADEWIGLYPQDYHAWPPGNWDYVSSYFTQGVIEGLQPTAEGWPAADFSHDGRLYADELFAFASQRIQEVGGSGGVYWHDIGSQELPLVGTSPTPEPASLLLFLTGGGGLLAFYRSRMRWGCH